LILEAGMWLFAKCIEATRVPGFIDAQHRTDGVYRRAGHVHRNRRPRSRNHWSRWTGILMEEAQC